MSLLEFASPDKGQDAIAYLWECFNNFKYIEPDYDSPDEIYAPCDEEQEAEATRKLAADLKRKFGFTVDENCAFLKEHWPFYPIDHFGGHQGFKSWIGLAVYGLQPSLGSVRVSR